ncbi:calponin homology domain-containing protein DDB_G0272472 isoform X2 [Anoplophora glabripennis]|uniref:calponin homology domain-containing protein DDB_G0272472 isoform X2 n=1 Tax=Anoplophora glabripennis TaxID=217634 RepID=UPI0008753A26|nr:calponin homology domain-containing protein DDB_G0272472 isoform X2 [Anoplophora glabripennis]
MESDFSGVNLEDREEGEIVDDDFEDISDNSIIVPIFSGKSVSTKEHLPAISLSSVTDADEPKSENKPRHRHKVTRKKISKSKKRRNSHRKSTCSDSDSDEYLELDRKLQKQLKAAIRVDDTEEKHKNSLQSRLKAMTKLDESDSCMEKNDNKKIEEKDTSDEGDSELAELRLEALRTAVLNKFMHRKKRKVKESNDHDVLSDASVKTDNSETNKENNHNTIENCPKKICIENSVIQNKENKVEITNNVIENNTPPEEDEDVLRALLLASMSRKITSEKETKRTVLPLTNNGIKHTLRNVDEKRETANLPINNVVNFKNRVTKINIAMKNLQLPVVKPLIININKDSDSEDDLFNKAIKNTGTQIVQQKQIDMEIEQSVDKFLKEQRAKVEAQLSPIPKCPAKPKNSSLILEKSCVKLLPKVKQVEYQKLLQRLKNAEKKPRVRRLSHKLSSEGKPVACTSKKIVRPKLPAGKQVTVSKVDPAQNDKSEVRTLHKILKEIQVQKNGRLQIQEKYKVLMPVIKKINEASLERRKCEDEVKRLLQEIADMKKKLTKSQQDFNNQVSNLVREKERIDKSMPTKKTELAEDKKARFTSSTPIKDKPSVVSFETSSLPTITPNNTLPLSEKIAEPRVGNRKEEDVVDAPLNPGDSNDIDIICSKQKNTFPKYISPLDKVKSYGRPVFHRMSVRCGWQLPGSRVHL